MNAKILGLCLGLVLSMFPATYPQAVPEAPPVNQGNQVNGEPLAIIATSDSGNILGRPMFVMIKIKNLTSNSLVLKNVIIKVDEAAQGRFADPLICKLQQLGEITLLQGQSYEQSCRFAFKKTELGWSLDSWQEKFLSANIRLALTISVKGQRDYHYYPVIHVNAEQTSIFLGGFAGALLLALFVWVQKLLSEKAELMTWLKSSGVTLLLGLRGGIMAVIALMLGQTTQGTGSPVALTVTDFSGGVMIGLFSYPLAAWLTSILKLDVANDTNDTAPSPASPPPAQSTPSAPLIVPPAHG